MDNNSSGIDNNTPGHTKDIVEQERIIQLLETAHQCVANLRLHIDDSTTTYFSSIIDIDLKEKIMLLELLRPGSGNALLNNSEQVNIEAFLKTSKLNWHSRVFKDDYTCIPDSFQVSMPTHILYTQQRLAHRIIPQDNIEVVLSHPEMKSIHGEIVNISVDGIAVKIPGNHIENINPGTFYQDCLMHLPKHDVLCAIEAKHRDNKTGIFGASFCGLSRLQQHTITQFIIETDRVSQRKSSKKSRLGHPS
ncbi:MAG: flagellar brake protein [Gammaproteobacteria bacterium]|nr:flagellar brake protein [Gammaproteobacteria bacterium]